MNKILVCTDGSAYSFVCYDYAAWLAGRTGAALEVLYVSDLRQFEVPMVADLSGSLGVQPYQAVLGRLQEFEQERAKAILEQARVHFASKAPRDARGFHAQAGVSGRHLPRIRGAGRSDHAGQAGRECEFRHGASGLDHGAGRPGEPQAVPGDLPGVQAGGAHPFCVRWQPELPEGAGIPRDELGACATWSCTW